MYIMYVNYYDIKYLNISNEDKQILKNFIELLDNYKYEPDKLVGINRDTLSHIFEITKVSPSLQIKIWQSLPDNIVESTENIDIFEDVLENKFGEYIHGIDKKALVQLLNSSRYRSRRNE